jgi:hypothetical protein
MRRIRFFLAVVCGLLAGGGAAPAGMIAFDMGALRMQLTGDP